MGWAQRGAMVADKVPVLRGAYILMWEDRKINAVDN